MVICGFSMSVSLCSSLTLEVTSDWLNAEKPQFPDEVAGGALKYMKLIKVRIMAMGSVNPRT
jgi:hypothetical protein